MKKITFRVLSILIILMLLINNSLLLIISNAIDEIKGEDKEEKVSPILQIDLQKYVNYKLDEDNKGLLLQFDVKSGIEYENKEYSPIRATGILMNVPNISGVYPQSVEVLCKTTKATNGDDSGKDFTYRYDSTTGNVKIAVLNFADEEGNFYTEKVDDAIDEYIVVCHYTKEAYDSANASRDLKVYAKIQEDLLDEDSTLIKDESSFDFSVDKNISGLISTEVDTSEIYNGYINSNINNGTSYKTEYNESLKLNISYKNIADEIRVSTKNNFVKEEVIETDDVVYTKTKVNKNEILDILGEDGYLKVLKESGEKLFEVNKDTFADEDGNIEVVYAEGLSKLNFVTSKPEKVGYIAIENNKEIKETMQDIENNIIQTDNVIKCVNEIEEDETTKEKEIYNFTYSDIVEINNAETRIDFTLDKEELTNSVQNDITFVATLVTNSNKYNLFKNPVIEIKLPSEVEKVILGDVTLVNEEELTVKKQEVIDSEQGKVIRVELDGCQNKYMLNSIIAGSDVVIPAVVIVKKDIPSVDSSIEITYTNETSTSIDYENEERECKNIDINIYSIISNTVATSRIMSTFSTMSVNTSSTTVDDADIDMQLKATVGNKELKDGDTVYEGQIIKYTAVVKNNSDKNISNFKFSGLVPEGTTYVTLDFGTDYETSEDSNDLYKYVEDASKKEYTEEFSLNAYEEKQIYYEVKVKKLADVTDVNINSNIKIYLNNVKKEEYSISNKIIEAEMEVELKSWKTGIDENVYVYRTVVTNNKDEDIKNAHIELVVPDGFEIWGIEDYDFDVISEDNKFKVDLEKIDANDTEEIDLYVKVNQSQKNVYDYDFSTYSIVTSDNTSEYCSNENRQTIYIVGIEVIQTSEKEGQEVKYGEEIEYNFVIKNVSNKNIEDGDVSIHVEDFLDENVEPVSAEYEVIKYDEETDTYSREVITENFKVIVDEIDGEKAPELQYYSYLLVGEEIKLKVKVKAELVSQKTPIISNISVEYNSITKISNTIKNVIVPEEYANFDIDSDDEEDYTKDKYSISGNAWADINNDGKLDETETKISGIKAILYDSSSNSIAKYENGLNITAVTDGNGKYEFKNINKGSYIVLFEYDRENYELSTYKKSGVDEKSNSNVIDKEININNESKTYAVTDIIKVSSKDIEHINIGLVPKKKFDLSLNKTITKVTVKYNGTEQVKEYNDSKLAKLEIHSKKIANTTIVVEYKIEVKNEGDIDAYVNEIVDYAPEGLEFDYYMNPEWTEVGNQNLKNSSLSGQRIAPGETKAVTLYLTKNMSEGSAGVITNAAEISSSSNIFNIKDTDSVEGNKDTEEDDYSEAQLIISVGTGAITYTLIIISVLVVLIILKYLIDKKIINLKIVSAVLIVLTVAGIVMYADNVDAIASTKEKYISDIKANIIKKINDAGFSSLNLRYTNYTKSAVNNFSNKNDDIKALGFSYDGMNTYLHHWDDDLYNKYTKILHCSDGRRQCGQGPHIYKLKNIDVNIKGITGTRNDYSFELKDTTGNKPSAEGVEDETEAGKKFVGPFKVNIEPIGSYDPDDYTYSYSLLIKDDLGNEVDAYSIWKSKTSKISSIKSGESFYIRVNSGTTIKSIKVTAKTTIQQSTTAKYSVKETWKCVRIGCNRCGGVSRMQVMVRSYTGEEEEKQAITIKTSVTLYTQIPKKANLNIIKVDNAVKKSNQKVSDFLNDGNVLSNNTLNAGFVQYYYGDYGELDYLSDIDDINNVTKLNGISFVIARRRIENGHIYLDLMDDELDYVTIEDTEGITNDPSEDKEKWKRFIEEEVLKEENDVYLFDTGYDGTKNGQILIKGLPVETLVDAETEDYSDKYMIIEILSEDEKYTQEGYPYVEIDLHGKTTNTVGAPLYIPNDANKGTELTGYVWLDSDDRNNYYNNGEKGVDGIKVKLVDKSGNVVTNLYGETCKTETNELGLFDEIEGGEYAFSGVDADKLADYHVEFTYNGLLYQAVTVGYGSDKKVNSKAIEKDGTKDTRNELDEKFKNGIVNNNDSNSVKVSGRNDITIGYEDVYKDGKQQYGIKQIKESSIVGCDVKARTQVSGWDSSDNLSLQNLYNENEDNIKYINLGIYEKPQADLAIDKDVDNINIGNVVMESFHEVTANENTNGVWDNSINFQKNSSGYGSSFVYEDIGTSDAIITYKIAIINQSSYNTKTNTIVDYYSNDYIMTRAYTNGGNSLSFTESSYDANHKKAIIETNMQTDANKGNCIYVEYRIPNNILKSMSSETYRLEKNIAEINSYTVYKDEYLNTVAVVDKDSVPGNANPLSAYTRDIVKYEDDTKSIDFTIRRNKYTERTISGNVFEDKVISEGIGKERKGNGIYDSEENLISNVKVSLMRLDGGNWATVDTTTTDSNGYYIFNYNRNYNYYYDYKIVFEWGDIDHKVQEWKGTIYKKDERNALTNTDWIYSEIDEKTYRTRYSDAIDDYEQRLSIDKQMYDITDSTVSTELENAYRSSGSEIATKIKSITPKFRTKDNVYSVPDVRTSYSVGEDGEIIETQVVVWITVIEPITVENVDFGIIERAKQEIDTEKVVDNFKITLSNGNEIANAGFESTYENGEIKIKPYKKIDNYTTVQPRPNGFVKTEIDNEILQNAKVETNYKIWVISKSEIDYMTEEYYKYGTVPTDKEKYIVRLDAETIIDYLDSKYGYEASENVTYWSQKQKNEISSAYKLQKDSSLLNIRTLLEFKDDEDDDNKILVVSPLNPTATVDLKASKILTTTNEEMTYENDEEIVSVKKIIDQISDRKLTQHIGSVVKKFPYAEAEKVQITPPTGENRNYVIPIVVSIMSLIILGVGIYIIKIKVIDLE